MRVALQDVFRQHFGQFAKGRSLHPREQRAAYCISQCYQPALGFHTLSCPHGHFNAVQHHACRHRSCPRCANAPRQQWLATQLPKLLPCPHFHVIFTMPHALIALWAFNRAAMAQMLFDSARSSLLDLCADTRHLGVTPGLLMALHTWGRNLSHHPHMHCLVTAGGLDAAGDWRACKSGFLLPLEPLRQLFRGRLLCALQFALAHQRLQLPPTLDAQQLRTLLRQLWRAHWNLQINKPYAHGRGVALYLSKYVKGGPLGSDRRLHLTDHAVSFAYFDHRDAKRKNLTLAPEDFIARVLWHAPPKGQHCTRQAGLYASAHARQHREALKSLCPALPPAKLNTLAAHQPQPPAPKLASCPTCQTPLQRRYVRPESHQSGEFSNTSTPRPSHLGPTGRCNGLLTGGPAPPPINRRPSGAACQKPLN